MEENDELAATAVILGGKQITDPGPPSQLQMVVIGNGILATHALPGGRTYTIGRSNNCDVPVDDSSISRRHAILHIGDSVQIEDLGSVNGTRVRGNKLKPGRPAVISVGELVGLGSLSFILQQRARPVKPRRLWTHDYFEARLEEECAREERTAQPFALLRIHFEARAPESFVQDTLGELVRDSDILGHYGPHEYEVLLPDTPPERADEIVLRLETKLVERGLKNRIQVACSPRDGRGPYQLVAKVQAPARKAKPTGVSDIVVGDSQMQSLHHLVDQIASSNLGVLLLGETGVGKEVFARAIHRASPRSAGPFVELNCAALTETLLESELFGHEKGAFTNATTTKPGLIESAHGGTLLLDEIGDMPLATQAKLLRVLESSQLRRVGALKSRPIDVRFVAATNSDLEAQIAVGAFRRDLFFRLNGVTIVIPPLRERLGELEPLAQAFLRRAAPANSPLPPIAPETLELMKSYSWPGNVRELKHMIERALLLCGTGPIRPEHLPVEKMKAVLVPTIEPKREPTFTLGRKGPDEEQKWIMQGLERAGGNQTLAAKLLGISRRTLVNRLNEYKVQRPRKDRKK
ncbi:MAG TPA: sigma 54-interacting transcriptional regulator [Kofleriaceae bacterium]